MPKKPNPNKRPCTEADVKRAKAQATDDVELELKQEHDEGPDSPELMQRCMTCPYPPECCMGEKKCLADERRARIAIKESIVYAMGKGYRNKDIARMLGVSENYVANFIHRRKEGKEKQYETDCV